MTFKEIRYLIHSDLDLILDEGRITNVDTSSYLVDKYNNYEVIGIRSEDNKVVISLKPYKSVSDLYFEICKEYQEESSYQQCKK